MTLVVCNSKPLAEVYERSLIAVKEGQREEDQVRAQLARVVEEGASTLRITSYEDLEEIPEEMGCASKVYKLSIDNNYVLRRLPTTICHLAERLEVLDICYNALEELPAEICTLRYLQRLNCSNNRLRSVPTDIDRLGALEELNFDNNFVTAFPPNLGYMKKLKRFFLSNNPLVDEDDTQYAPYRPASTVECDLCKSGLDDNPILAMNFIDICSNKSVPVAYFLCRYVWGWRVFLFLTRSVIRNSNKSQRLIA